MPPLERLQYCIAWVLNIGVILSIGLVGIGSTLLLYQHGQQPLASLILPANQITIDPIGIWRAPFTSMSFIELGLLALVSTQVVRVMLLAAFYAYIRDIWFAIISLFILATLFVSFICR